LSVNIIRLKIGINSVLNLAGPKRCMKGVTTVVQRISKTAFFDLTLRG
jgi:hypothetical protein